LHLFHRGAGTHPPERRHLGSGDVAPTFPPFSSQKISVHIEQEWRDYKVSILELEQANKLFEAGTLPLHLHEAVVQHHEQIQQQEQMMSIPLEFNAVYLGIYDSLETCNAIEPWPRMGRFTIENGSRHGRLTGSFSMRG
jgi:hypothetical protein